MGFGVTELLIILVIVVLLFGGRKLKTLGSDLGGAIKGFRKAMTTTDETTANSEAEGGADEPAASPQMNERSEPASGDKQPPSS